MEPGGIFWRLAWTLGNIAEYSGVLKICFLIESAYIYAHKTIFYLRINFVDMKKVLKITYCSAARNPEHYQLFSILLSLLTEEFATKYKLTAYREQFAASFAKENQAYLQNQAYESTKTLEEKDQACNRRFRSFSLAVQSKSLSDVAEDVAAAERLLFGMKPYQGAAEKAYAEEIAMIKDLISLMASDKYAADVSMLGLDTSLTALKLAVGEMEAALSAQANERLARKSNDNMKAARPMVERDFADLSELISALYLVAAYVDNDEEKSTELSALIDSMNAEISRFLDTLSRRGVGYSPKPGTDTEPGTEEEPQPEPEPEPGEEGGTPGEV